MLTYPAVLPLTNLVYMAMPGGYTESVVPLASGTVSWHVSATGHTLAFREDGVAA
jgi:hypothetical protein